MEPPTIRLDDPESGLPIGDISDTQLQYLADHLEEDEDAPQTYYIDEPTIDFLQSSGADRDLVALLRRAVSGREGVVIRWTRI